MRVAAIFIAALVFAASSAGEKDKPFKQTPEETQLFELTNAERKKKDLGQLVMNPALSKIARAHAENMARQGKMEHKLDGKTQFDRLRAAGYIYEAASENLVWGEDGATVAFIIKHLMDSKVHRTNILYADYTETGVGMARDKAGDIYYAQLFGRPEKK